MYFLAKRIKSVKINLFRFPEGGIDVIVCEKNWVFATNSNFIIPLFVQPDNLHLFTFQTYIILSHRILLYAVSKYFLRQIALNGNPCSKY